MLSYTGPGIRTEDRYTRKFRPSDAVCKKGWCNSAECRQVAIGALLDRSSQHNRTESPQEIAVDVLQRPIPFEKGKVIMYASLLVKPVITDYVVVACCYRIGTYLAQIRKDH